MANDTQDFPRKYRPKTISEYIGNADLKKAVFSALAKGNRPQVVLLKGASGCGKTTFARLLAKEYQCENRDPVNGACNVCTSCLEFNEYIETGDASMLQYIREVNVAQDNGKKDIEVFLDEMVIPTFDNQWRVYIMDEVHAATLQAQNRMLKITEEPPENVLIVFCTTNPEGLLDTLVNRCRLKLAVRKPTVADLANLLKKVCICEDSEYDMKGLNYIATTSELTIRESLSSLERVLNEESDAKYSSAVKVFNEVSDELITEFYRKLIGVCERDKMGMPVLDSNGNMKIKRDVTGYIAVLNKIKTSTDLQSFVTTLSRFTMRGIYCINQAGMDMISEVDLKTYKNLFGNFTVEQMASLLRTISDLKSTDVELKLLLLGYTGLTLSSPTSVMELPSIDVGEHEIANEMASNIKNRDLLSEELLQKGIANCEIGLESATSDDIQALFNAPDVREQ